MTETQRTQPENQGMDQTIEAGKTEGEASESFEQLLKKHESFEARPLEPGRVRGEVVAITDEYVVVDVGRKVEAVLPLSAVQDPRGKVTLAVGDQVEARIAGRTPEGFYLLSLIEADRPRTWEELEEAHREGKIVAGTVTEAVKGGFRVDLGVPAFLPISKSGIEPGHEESLVGQEIRCRLLEVNRLERRVIVDRRSVLEEEEEKRRQERLAGLQPGDIVEGVVKRMMPYGAFVDLGGIEGLLHVSDMSWGRVEKPEDVVQEGQTIRLRVLQVDRESRKISLGLKQLEPDPWTRVAEKYPVGQKVKGKVVRLADFGAFVELEPGVEGLIHISEMSWSRKVRKPGDVVKEGEVVEAVVLDVKPEEKRLSLGLKQVFGDPWERVEEKYPVESVVEGVITSLQPYGVFVEVEEGVEGFIHISDLSGGRRIKHPKEVVAEGQRVRAVVLEVDKQRRRMKLGMRQLEPTTADQYIAEHSVGDQVSGRVVEVRDNELVVEVAEGVMATCQWQKPPGDSTETPQRVADLDQLTKLLAARWKGQLKADRAALEPPAVGQIREFRIKRLEPKSKRIELELVR